MTQFLFFLIGALVGLGVGAILPRREKPKNHYFGSVKVPLPSNKPQADTSSGSIIARLM